MLRSVHRSVTSLSRRTALPLLASRPLSSSPRLLLGRPPTFTTPEPAQSPTQTAPLDPSEPLPPLPPTNLPVEDYASPLLHTASFFSQLFRYAVFGSVALVTLSIGSFIAGHLYIEHVALAPPALSSPQDDPDEWTDELEGWSGAHTGNGGTDPRLGVIARAAVRAAYVSQRWGVGSVASVSHAQPSSSAFGALARPGGEMIGYKEEIASLGKQVNDGGWLGAERYLVFAMEKAAKKGISLVNSVDWEAHVETGGVDRAAVELEERLAGLRERIGGRYRLEAAREGWERIYLAIAASPTTGSAQAQVKEAEWERREKLKASRKMGELSARIAELWREGSDERLVENRKAEGWFVGGLTSALAEVEGQSLKGTALDNLVPSSLRSPSSASSVPAPEPKKHASPVSSFFGFWSRSHPPSSPSSSSAAPVPSNLSSELSHLLALVPSSSSSCPISSPATSRAVLSSLISLETFLARRRDASTTSSSSPSSSLTAASAIQRSTLAFLDALSSSSSSTTSPSSFPLASPSRTLTSLFLTTRRAALQSHLAECSLALVSSSSRRGPSSADVESALSLLSQAKASVASGGEAVGQGWQEKEKKAFGEHLERIERDRKKVGEIVEGLTKVVEGLRKK
ncbi:hypothetical protein JCM8547_004517 [Rhodosporidiobolus lusitaniae]